METGLTERSQVSVIGAPPPKSWDDFEQGCLLTFGGGYRTEEERDVFRHGMQTVFNLLRAEFPAAEQCKAAPALLDACRAAREVMTAVYSLRSDGPGRQAYDKLRAAIAQAVIEDISEAE